MSYNRDTKKWNPVSLEHLARTVVNCNLSDYEDISKLQLPNCLLHRLRRRYIKDRFYCDEELPGVFEDEEFPFFFEEPFINIGPDAFITIQKWGRTVPPFAFEFNHLQRIFYQLFNGESSVEQNYFCLQCAMHLWRNDRRYTHLRKMHDCEITFGSELIDRLQSGDLWCRRCHSTSLFWIEDSPTRYHKTNVRLCCYERIRLSDGIEQMFQNCPDH